MRNASCCVAWVGVLMFTGVFLQAEEEFTVALEGVPEELALPLEEGKNVVITARVRPEEGIRAVWLATGREARARYHLVRVGPGEYQANLADPVLSAMLRAHEGEHRFRIYAEDSKGRIVQSIAVQYRVRRPKASPPRIFVYEGLKRKELASLETVRALSELGLRAHFSGSDLWVLPSAPPSGIREPEGQAAYYLDPGAIRRIEIWFDRSVETPQAEARAGDVRRVLRSTRAPNVLRLEVDGSLREAWSRDGRLTLAYRSDADDEGAEIVLRARPMRIELPEGGISFELVQRGRKAVPGSQGYVIVEIGDITRGQTLVRVYTADGRVLLDDHRMREGESARFTFGGKEYAVRVEKLFNVLFSEDYATLRVLGAEDIEENPTRKSGEPRERSTNQKE